MFGIDKRAALRVLQVHHVAWLNVLRVVVHFHMVAGSRFTDVFIESRRQFRRSNSEWTALESRRRERPKITFSALASGAWGWGVMAGRTADEAAFAQWVNTFDSIHSAQLKDLAKIVQTRDLE